MDSRRPSGWRYLLSHRQGVRPACPPRTCMATGGVGGQRWRVRGPHLVRALPVTQRTSRHGIARGPRGCDRCRCPRGRGDAPCAGDHIDDSAGMAHRPGRLAGDHSGSRVSWCPRGRSVEPTERAGTVNRGRLAYVAALAAVLHAAPQSRSAKPAVGERVEEFEYIVNDTERKTGSRRVVTLDLGGWRWGATSRTDSGCTTCTGKGQAFDHRLWGTFRDPTDWWAGSRAWSAA